jgi:eukaryotic-like serine/threonine-protein kinase
VSRVARGSTFAPAWVDNVSVVGTTLSRYHVVAHLGSGGMGDVYRADDERLRRPVALKVIRPDTVGAQAAERLLAEARAASSLSHPNIAVIYEVDEAEVDGTRLAFIAMEFVAGRTLADLAATRALTSEAVLDIGRQVADALAAAHEHGLVHRDIKPSNLMLTEAGLVKVLDFGVAYRMASVASPTDETTRPATLFDAITQTGRDMRGHGFTGTLPYTAPEQATGRDVDGRADMFSLGVVLYELLAGERPFQGETPLQLLGAILTEAPRPLPARADDPRLPRMERVIRRMLAKDRGDRYASLRDVAAALAEIIDAPEADAGVSLSGADGAEDGRSLAVTAFTNISGNPEDDWLGTGLAETLTADLSRLDDDLTVVARERVHELLRTLSEQVPDRGASLFLRVGRELGVRWIVNGGFQRTGDAMRVTASLTDIATGRLVRTVKVDGRADGIFAVQDRVVSELVESLRPAPDQTRDEDEDARAGGSTIDVDASTSRAGAARHRRRSTDRASATADTRATGTNVTDEPAQDTTLIEAYEAFSKGVTNLRVESYETLDRAVILFEKAVRLDPRYARAWLELGAAYGTKADYLGFGELRERAHSALRRALELRPDSVRAWRELGALLVAMNQQREGRAAIERALALDPTDAGALAAMGRALFLGEARFHDAANYYDRALEQNPKGGWYALQLAHCSALAREFARGEEAASRAVVLQESFLSGGDGVVLAGAYMRLGHLAALQEHHTEAVEQFLREIEFLGRVDHALRNRTLVELNVRLGSAYLRLGQDRKAQAAFDIALEGFERRLRLGADDPYTRYYAACVHALRGDVETALVFLERSAAERPALTRTRARIEPEFASLRDDDRFTRFVEAR